MDKYRRFALLTTAATYFLIFVGGLVRVAGAGMGCPDWPKCFGSWIPPLSIDQLPPEIDLAGFNVTLAWIEYINRLVGVSVGFLILITAILAIRYFRRTPAVLYPSLAAAVLVAFQGWQGSVIVSTQLQPFVVSIHMLLALMIVSLLLYATLASYARPWTEHTGTSPAPRNTRTLISVLWLVTIVQIVLGSQVRQALETAAKEYPLWSGRQLFETIGPINDFHFILGILVIALTFYVGQAVLRARGAAVPMLKMIVRAMFILVLLQAALGVVLQLSGLPALIDVFHLWLAALFVGLLLLFHALARQPSEQAFGWNLSFSKLVWVTVAVALVMGIGAYVVIEQAEQSRLILAGSEFMESGSTP